jgi:hypothetical protein
VLISIVTDEGGNRNNVLVVHPVHHVEHTHVHKHIHARPLRRSDESSTAWDIVEADIVPFNTPSAEHQEYSTSKTSREGLYKTSYADTTLLTVGPAPDASKDRRNTALPTPSETVTDNFSIPTLEVNKPDEIGPGSPDIDTERYGDRKMSTVDIEKVKLLMSMPNPSGSSPTVLAAQDGEIFEIDQKDDVPRSPERPAVNMHSHAPLLSHECLTCDFGAESSKSEGNELSKNHSNSSDPDSPDDDPPTPDDYDSPYLEIFPTGAKNILQRIATLQLEIPPDGAAAFESGEGFSPAPLTKDAPTFPHELPPIGSPAANRRRKESSSEYSPEISKPTGKVLPSTFSNEPNVTDGSTDFRRLSISPQNLPPSAIALDAPPRKHLRPDTPNSDLDDTKASQPLLSVQDALKAPATYGTTSHSPQSSIASEGARLRNAKTADLISSTEDSSSASDKETEPVQSLWQKILAWFSQLWARFRGTLEVD